MCTQLFGTILKTGFPKVWRNWINSPNVIGYSERKILHLKGKCHEIVVEMSPWSSTVRYKLMVADSFFCFKIGRTVHRETHSSMLKLVLEICRILLRLGFYFPGLSWRWHIGQSPLAYRAVTTAIWLWSHNHCANCQHSPSCFFAQTAKSLWSIFCRSGSSRNDFATISSSRPLAYHSLHSAICQWIGSRVVAQSAGSGEQVLHRWMH
jgi:hypothetical protein